MSFSIKPSSFTKLGNVSTNNLNTDANLNVNGQINTVGNVIADGDVVATNVVATTFVSSNLITAPRVVSELSLTIPNFSSPPVFGAGSEYQLYIYNDELYFGTDTEWKKITPDA